MLDLSLCIVSNAYFYFYNKRHKDNALLTPCTIKNHADIKNSDDLYKYYIEYKRRRQAAIDLYFSRAFKIKFTETKNAMRELLDFGQYVINLQEDMISAEITFSKSPFLRKQGLLKISLAYKISNLVKADSDKSIIIINTIKKYDMLIEK